MAKIVAVGKRIDGIWKIETVLKRRLTTMNVCLDRFSQGLADPQEVDFYECQVCGSEVYEGEGFCRTCVEKKLQKVSLEIENLLDKYNVEIRAKGPNIIIVDNETREEIYF